MSDDLMSETAGQTKVVSISSDEDSERERRVRRKRLGLYCEKGSTPVENLDNAVKIIAGEDAFAELRPWFDSLSSGLRRQDSGRWSDKDTLACQRLLQSRFDMPRIRKNTVSDAVYAVGEANARDPATEWASKCALSWDRRPRIARFLDDVFECGQNDYTEAVSRNLFIGMAARIMSPGCMLHTMVVLESEKQGVGKSSVCEALVPKEWFGVINRSPDDPKFISELQGKVLLEVAEMSAFSRADKRKIKSMLTVPSDFHLLPYAHHAVDLPRHCTFIGTTNRNDYLDDETGNRRFLPIRCSNNLPPVHEIIERVTRMRDQLMGEAVTLFQKGATWHEINVELATEQQNERMEHDAWMDVLADWRGIGRSGSAIRLHEQTGRRFVTVSDILLHALGVDVSKQTKADQMRLTVCLKRLGWRRDKLWFETRSQNVWLIPGS